MSDSIKLRKKQGNIWLGLSFFLFTICICLIWLTFLSSLLIFLFGGGLILIFIGYFCIDFAKEAYKRYVGVSEEEIAKYDSAKLKKINGISELICAYVFLALAISTIWAIFVFTEISSSILPIFVITFGVFAGTFYGFVMAAINNFIAIDRCVKENPIKSKSNGDY